MNECMGRYFMAGGRGEELDDGMHACMHTLYKTRPTSCATVELIRRRNDCRITCLVALRTARINTKPNLALYALFNRVNSSISSSVNEPSPARDCMHITKEEGTDRQRERGPSTGIAGANKNTRLAGRANSCNNNNNNRWWWELTCSSRLSSVTFPSTWALPARSG